MTLDRDSQLKSLVDDITALLTNECGAADGGAQPTMSSRTKDILGRAQTALSELVDSGASETSGSPIIRSVETEIQRLREETLSPLKADLDGLRQQQRDLTAEVALLEQQRQYHQSLAQQQSNQAQMLDDLVQPLRDRLETAVTEQVSKLLAEFKQGGSDPGGDRPDSALNHTQINRVQEQSNEVLEQLQDTLQTVFSALQANTQRYESTIQSSLTRIQTLGEQSEAILEHWLGRLTKTGGERSGDGVPQGNFATAPTDVNKVDLSDTDPVFSGVPYPGMDLPAAAAVLASPSALPGDEAAAVTRSMGSSQDWDDGDNPFALGDLDITDLSYTASVTSPQGGRAGSDGDGDGDIDFTTMDGVKSPVEPDTILDEVEGTLDDSSLGTTEDTDLVNTATATTTAADATPILSDPQAERPLMGLNMEDGVAADEEVDEDEDATVIQYVRVDMLSQRREETFRMPDVLVNLSADPVEPKMADDWLSEDTPGDESWQGDDDAAQYLSEDLSGLESSEPEGIAEVSVNLDAPPMAEVGVVPSEEGDVWDEMAEVSESTTEGAEAAASFAAIAPETGGLDVDFPVMPSASSPEEAVIEETSGLDVNPVIFAQALDADGELGAVDLDLDAEGTEEIADEAGDRDELLMEEMLAVGSTDEQLEAVIAADAGDGLDDLLDIGGEDEAVSLNMFQGEEETQTESVELVTNLDELSAEAIPEVEMVADLPAVEVLMEEASTPRSLDPEEEDESMTVGASDLDELGIGGERPDPFEGVDEGAIALGLEATGTEEETGTASEEDSSGLGALGLGSVAAAAAAVGFGAFGGGDAPEDIEEIEGIEGIGEDDVVADDSAGDIGLDETLDLASDLAKEDSLDLEGFGETAIAEATEAVEDTAVTLEGEFGSGGDLDLAADAAAPEAVAFDNILVEEALGGGTDEDLFLDLGDESAAGAEDEPAGLELAGDGDLDEDLDDLGLEDTLEPQPEEAIAEESPLAPAMALEDLTAELPESLPESADGEVAELLDDAMTAADAMELSDLDLPQGEMASDGDALGALATEDAAGDELDLGDFGDLGGDELGLETGEDLDAAAAIPADEGLGALSLDVLADDDEAVDTDGMDDVPVDLELEAVLGGDGTVADPADTSQELGLGEDDGAITNLETADSENDTEEVDLTALAGDLDLELADGLDQTGTEDALDSAIAGDGDAVGDIAADFTALDDGLTADGDDDGLGDDDLGLDLDGFGDGSGEAELDNDGETAETAPADAGLDLDLGGLGLDEPVSLDLGGLADVEPEATDGAELDAFASEDEPLVDLGLEAIAGDEAVATDEVDPLTDLDSLAGDGAATDDDLGLDLDLDGETSTAANLDLDGLGGDNGEDLELDLDSADVEADLDLGSLGATLSDEMALELDTPSVGDAQAETISSLDEALELGDVTAVPTETDNAGGAEPEEEFSLEMLDNLTEFPEEASPMADIDADLDAFLADALGPDADGVEKKKE